MRGFIIIGFLFFSLPALAENFTAESRITDVTVYTDRATITRKATLTLPAGDHNIVFENLAAGLYPDSLRVMGTGNAVLGAVQYKVINAESAVNAREANINAQIESLQEQISLTDAEIAAVKRKLAFYDRLIAEAADRQSEEIAALTLKPESWEDAAYTVFKATEEAEKAIIQKQFKKKKIDEKIAALNADLAQIRTGAKSSVRVSVPIEVKSEGVINLALDYQIGGTGWRPVYDARLDSENEDLTITQYGSVTQRTGEDWSGVKLTLSTAQPQRASSLPPLHPMWVNFWDGSFNRKAIHAESLGAQLSMADSAMIESRINPPALEQPVAAIDTEGLNAKYIIPGPADVAADGSETKLKIGRFETTHSLERHIKPQLSQNAFVVAKTKLTGESPLLPGNVSLFRDGGFIGSGALPMLRTGEETDLYFGIDDQISVTRETVKAEDGKSGLLRDNEREKAFITKIMNTGRKPVRIVLTESTPAPRNEKIEVEIISGKTTQGYTENINDKAGLLQWAFDLEPGAQNDIKLGWRVTWPKDKNINGL